MSIFEEIKAAVPIVDAARRYGLEVNRHGKALCPFHNDHKPSLSFKGQIFKCFACDEGGDVIKLVQCLLGLARPTDAAKELNDAYGLGITFGQGRTPYTLRTHPDKYSGLSRREYEIITRELRRMRFGRIYG